MKLFETDIRQHSKKHHLTYLAVAATIEKETRLLVCHLPTL